MDTDEPSDAAPGAGRGRRLATAGLAAAVALGALGTLGARWAAEHAAPAEARPAQLVATDLAPLAPTFPGVVPGSAAPREERWRVRVADVLDVGPGSAAGRSRLRVVPAAAPVSSAGTGRGEGPSEHPVVVLAEAVRAGGPTGHEAVARVAAVDAVSGRIRWRGPESADIADCVRLLTGEVGCLERWERSGRLVILDGDDGAVRARVELTGRPTSLAADGSGLVTVAGTPAEAGTEITLARWDPDGAPRWARSYAAPAGVTPGAVRALAGALVVEQATVDGAALIVDDRDGSLAAARPPGPAVGMLHGRPVFDPGGERLSGLDGPLEHAGGELRGSPVGVSAADGTVVSPTLVRRFGSADGAATLHATPAPGTPGRAWSLPAARPLAACAGQLVLAIDTDSGSTLRAVDPATGTTRWEAPRSHGAPRSSACTSRTLLVPEPSADGVIAEYDLASGTRREGAPGGTTDAAPGRGGSVDLPTDRNALLALGTDASGAWVALLA